ncbi:hypothetical protein D3C71_1143110 [compost metagenome]
MAVVRQAVAADHGERVRNDALHVFFLHLEIAGAAGLQPQAGFLLGGAPLARDVGDQAAGHLGVRVGPGQQHVDHAVDQVFAQHGGAGHVGVDVHRDLLALRQRLDQRQRLLGAAPVRGAGALVVRDDQRHARAEGRVAGLVQRLDDLLHLAAQVRGVHAAMARDDARERGDFLGRRGKGFFVEQARRQAVRARGHAVVEQRGHVCQFIAVRGPVECLHRREAQRGVAHERGHVERRLRRIDGRTVLGHGRVLERVRTQQRERRLRLRRAVRRQRDAAVARDHGGDALRHLGQAQRVAQHDGVVVRVGVDEAGRDHLAAAVDHVDVGDVQPCRQPRAQAVAQRQDAVALQQHVAGPRRAARAVDHEAGFEQHGLGVAHGSLSPFFVLMPPPSQLCSGCVVASMPWRWKASRARCRRCTAGSPRRCATSTVRISMTVRCVR